MNETTRIIMQQLNTKLVHGPIGPTGSQGPKGDKGADGTGVQSYATLSDLQTALPNGSNTPVWVTSEYNWYYWKLNSWYSLSGGVISDTTTPSNVNNLTTSGLTQTGVTLNWIAATDNVAVTGYEVYNGASLLTTVTGTTHTITGLTNSTQYTFWVKAKDAANNVASGTSVIITTSAPSGVLASGVTLDKTTVSIEAGSTSQLTATVSPSNADVKTVTWSSNNTAIATVNNSGLVTAVAAGSVTITVTTTDGAKTATSSFTVTQAIVGFDYNNLTAQYTKDTPVIFDQVVQSKTDYVHPSVLYFENSWNGHKYWMGVNPYPGTQGAYENPFIFYSDDGENWTTPAGLTQPIYPLAGGFNNNSDAHIIMDYDGVTMHYLNRAVRSAIPNGTTSTATTSSVIELFSSTNGVNWTARQTILDTVVTGYDIVAPSMCKLNSKYYMFGTDIMDQTHITIFEATNILGPYTEINRISTGSLGTLWHCEVRYINGEFIVIGSTNGAQGGSLMLGKFSNVLDTTVIGRNNFFAVPSSSQLWNVAIYKSSLIVKPDNTIEVFIGYKGSALNTNTQWKIVKTPVSRISQTLDLANAGYGVENYTYADNSTGVAPGKSFATDYYKYAVDFTVTDITGKFTAYAFDATQWAGIYIDAVGGTLYAEVWKNGSNSKVALTYGLSVNDRVTFDRDTDCKVYINGRLVHTFTGLDVSLDKIGSFLGDMNSKVSMSNIKVYIKGKYLPTQAKADTQKSTYLTEYTATPSDFSLVDEFNRASGWTSDNSVAYELVGTPTLTGTELKPNGSGNIVLVPTTADYSVMFKLTAATLVSGFNIYLRYTDANNHLRLKIQDGVLNFIVYNKVGGVETPTTFPLPFANSKYRNYRWDLVGTTLSLYMDGLFWKSVTIPTNTHGNKVGFSSGLAATTYDYAIVKNL